MNIVSFDEGVLNVNYKGKLRVGDRDGSSTMLFIDSENGVVDIGGEGSDNTVRVEQGKITILTTGKVNVQGESMTQPCGAEPLDEDLAAGHIAFFSDEVTGRIRFKFKDSEGVVHVDDVGAYEVGQSLPASE